MLVFEHSGEQGLLLAETCRGLVRQECTGMQLLAENSTWLPKQHRWELARPMCSLAAQNINWHPGTDPIICLGGCPAKRQVQGISSGIITKQLALRWSFFLFPDCEKLVFKDKRHKSLKYVVSSYRYDSSELSYKSLKPSRRSMHWSLSI